MGLREIYDLPRRSGVFGRMWIVMLLVVAVALALWLALPDSPFTVAATAIAVLVLVGVGVGVALSSRQASEPPGRDPERPPSVSSSSE